MSEARQELEQLVLLESVAEGREERIRAFLHRLVQDFGLAPEEVARRLGISVRSVESLVSASGAAPVSERLDISEQSVRRLLED
jgi:DNA-directed RNA polymerase specialized sigma24 family protein